MHAVFRIVLALIIAANFLGLLTLLLHHQQLVSDFAGLQPWMLPALALLSSISIVACLALWFWKAWGFALLGTSYALMFAINLSFAAPLAHVLLGPLGLLVLAAAAWPVRTEFTCSPAA